MKDYEGEKVTLTDDLSIKGLPYTLLKELNWNTSDHIFIAEYDKVHKTITLGKKLSGAEAVASAQKIAEELRI